MSTSIFGAGFVSDVDFYCHLFPSFASKYPLAKARTIHSGMHSHAKFSGRPMTDKIVSMSFVGFCSASVFGLGLAGSCLVFNQRFWFIAKSMTTMT